MAGRYRTQLHYAGFDGGITSAQYLELPRRAAQSASKLGQTTHHYTERSWRKNIPPLTLPYRSEQRQALHCEAELHSLMGLLPSRTRPDLTTPRLTETRTTTRIGESKSPAPNLTKLCNTAENPAIEDRTGSNWWAHYCTHPAHNLSWQEWVLLD